MISTLNHLLIFYFFFIPSISKTTDTLALNQSLSGDQTIISKGYNFELGFFKAGNFSNYYIGIWYKKIPSNPPTVVWVANRDTPVFDRFRSKLTIIDGNLVILNESSFQIWSTNVTTTTTATTSLNYASFVVIRDDGNLVLTDGSNSVWQSFDYPVHTWLPGAKLAYGNVTKISQLLTSWKSEENPGLGLFSLEPVPSNQEFIIKWNRSIQYWTGGSWNGTIYDGVPKIRLDFIHDFGYISNANESYFTYSVSNSSIITRFVMDVSGQLQLLTWVETTKQWSLIWAQPISQCQVYDLCGGFGICRQVELLFCSCLTGFKPRSKNDWNHKDFSSGCVRKTDLECESNKEKVSFFMINVTSLPPNYYYVAVGSLAECRNACLKNCVCNAYSFEDNQCSVWDGHLLNLSEGSSNGKHIYIKLALKDLPQDIKNTKEIDLGTIIGSIAAVVFIMGLILLIIYRKKRDRVGKAIREGSLMAFVYRDLQIATKNFSDRIGGGGFGSVFKGVLPDSTIVAVKRLESISQGDKQFRSEVATIGTIQHIHLIRLRGFCAEGDKKLLVYDFMPNGSLHSHLFNEKQDNVLNWKMRYQIALGIAKGLVYLHEKCRECIIHCDIKPGNILLDADFHPKIADFGMAKLVGRDFSRVLTTMRGTRGYLAPEWLSGEAVTPKADVFSYGMMLFELVHGKRNAELFEDLSFRYFPSFAANVVVEGGDILSLLDSRLKRDASIEEVTKILKVAYWCIQDEEDNRPSMGRVEQILEGLSDVNMPPIPQSLQFFADNTEHLQFFIDSSSTRSSQVHRNSLG